MSRLDIETRTAMAYLLHGANCECEHVLAQLDSVIPEDAHDWEIHGVHASDIYMRLRQILIDAKNKRQSSKLRLAL